MSDSHTADTNYGSDLFDRYAEGDVAAMLEIEYLQLVQCARRFSERDARHAPSSSVPSARALLSRLASDELPEGEAPSLSDALHALDLAYAGWQAESVPFQRAQARMLAYHLGQLEILALFLGLEGTVP